MGRWPGVDATLDRPVFKQIADMLRDSIESGQIQAGDWLPSEADLCSEFGVGRNSVRSALRVLIGEGRLSSHAGKGHQVREHLEPSVVTVGPGCRISARMPTEEERRRFGMAEGTPLLVIDQGGEVELYPADRTVAETAQNPVKP